MIKAISHSVWNSLVQIRRDPLLVIMLFLLVLLILAFRWLIPYFALLLDRHFDFDLTPYYGLITSIIPNQIVIIIGAVMGFLMLDQKDDRTLWAIAVSPLSVVGYVASILILPLLVYMITASISVPLIAITEIDPLGMTLYVLGALPFSAIIALSLAVFAQNKIQGLALSKVMGILLWLPVIAWFLSEPWQWLFAFSPSFWSAKLTWLILEDGAMSQSVLMTFAGALIWQLVLIFILVKRLPGQ